VDIPKNIDEWIDLARKEPLQYAAAYLDLVTLAFNIPVELKGQLSKAMVAILSVRLKNASRKYAVFYKTFLKSIATARESGASEAAQQLLDEINRITGGE